MLPFFLFYIIYAFAISFNEVLFMIESNMVRKCLSNPSNSKLLNIFLPAMRTSARVGMGSRVLPFPFWNSAKHIEETVMENVIEQTIKRPNTLTNCTLEPEIRH